MNHNKPYPKQDMHQGFMFDFHGFTEDKWHLKWLNYEQKFHTYKILYQITDFIMI